MLQTQKGDDVIEFDPKLHLALEVPSHIKVLQSDPDAGHDCVKLVQVPALDPRNDEHLEDLAYTEPFRVFSDQGLQVFQSIVTSNESMAISTPRNPKIIRGLGHKSHFVRDFNESPELLSHLSKFANIDIAAHPLTTNYSQINFGDPPKDAATAGVPADRWHLDSVDYVLVIMLSDGFEGGELLVSNMDPNQAMEKVKMDTLPDELTSRVKFTPGYGVFMQGSRIAHAVAPLTGGVAPRISVVNSYVSRDALRVDRPSIYNSLAINHSPATYNPEFLRHVAWRCMGKLDYLVKNPNFDSPQDGEDLLDLVIEQLSMAKRLMKGEEKHDVPMPKTVQELLGKAGEEK